MFAMCVLLTTVQGFALDYSIFRNDSKSINKNAEVASSIANIGDSVGNLTSEPSVKYTPSGVVTLKLYAIGSGLVDADWKIKMSKGLISYIDMVITIRHGFLYLSEKNYAVIEDPNWTSEEYGSVQSEWEVGKKLKSDLSGSVEINGQYDFPINSADAGVTTVE